MDKRLLMVIIILVFGYIGFTNNSHGADTYNSMVPGFFDNVIDKSKLFLVLLITLGGCYLFKSKELAIIYSNKEDNNSEDNNSEETNSEENSSSDCIDGTTTETPSEQQDVTNDEIASEDVLKEKYGVDGN